MNNHKIVFFDDSHTYWLGNTQLESVGSWINPIFPPFEGDYWQTHRALQSLFGDEYTEHYRSFKRFMPDGHLLFAPFLVKAPAGEFVSAKKKISDEWGRKRNESAFKGTRFHNEQEKLAYEDGFMMNPWDKRKYDITHYEKEYDNESLTLDLSTLPDGAYPELVIFDLDLGKCGQADKVFIETIEGKRYVDIDDHKTNEKKPPKSAPNYCNDPFEDQYASKHFKYVLQINAYAYLLSRHGFIPRNLGYTHYKDYDPKTANLVEVDNLQEKFIELF